MDATQPLGNTSSLGWPSCCHIPYWKAGGQTFLSTTAVFSFLGVNCSHGFGCMECHLECSGILNAFSKGASNEQSFINLEAFVHLVFGGHPPCCVRKSPDHNVVEVRKFILSTILRVSTLLESEAQNEHNSCDNTLSRMFCSGICIKLESEVAVPIVNSWSSDVVLSTENIHETLYGSLTQASSDTLTGTNPALQDAETRSPIDVTSSHNLTGTLQTPPVSDGNALTKTVPVNAVVVSSDTFSSTVTSVGSLLDGNGNGFRNGFHQAEVPTDNGNTLPTAERDPSIELEVNLSEGCSSNSGNTLVRCTSIQRNVGILASPFVARSTRSKTKVCSNSKAKTSDLLECNIKFPAETSSNCFTLGSDGKESSSSSFTNGATKVSSNRSGGSRSSQKQQRLFDLRAKACQKQPILSHTRDKNRERKSDRKRYKKDSGENVSLSSTQTTPEHREETGRDKGAKQTTASKCRLCRKKFVSPKLLADHLRSHITVSEPDTCPVCRKVFHSKYTLQAHMNSHTGYRPHKCNHCYKTFATPSNLSYHKVHNCIQYRKDCAKKGVAVIRPYHRKKAVRTSKPLNRKQSCHDKEVIPDQVVANTCTLCSETFSSSELLSNHFHSHVDTCKPCTCPLCGKKCAHKSSLCAHINLHAGYQPFECEHCHTKFHGQASFENHIYGRGGQHCHTQVAKQNGNICTICKESVSSPELLSQHLRSHVKDEDSTVCPLCEKKLSKKQDLFAHIDNHTGHKPYSCGRCDMKFTRYSSLYNHQTLHNNTCNKCDKKFKSAKGLRTHLRRDHLVGNKQ